MKIKELINYGINELNKNNIEDSNIKTKALLKYILKKDNNYLIINYDEDVNIEDETEYKKYIKELINGKPLQYITHQQEFMNIGFYVDENVLIPQPDTEILVEEALIEIKKRIEKLEETKLDMAEEENEKNKRLKKDNIIKVLDLCTGNGAIAISLAKYLQENIVVNNIQKHQKNINHEKAKIQVEIYASDISSKALKIAKKNTEINDVAIHFILSDMFENVEEKFDVVVSNPPYIEKEEISNLSKDVQNEPHLALDGGQDGLDFYRIIAKQKHEYLKDNGTILLEIGYNQKESVIKLFEKNNEQQKITCIKDLAGNDRVIKICI